MRLQEIIAKKRDRNALEKEEISCVVTALVNGSMSDAQVGAFAMAVYLNGMTASERVALTTAMQHSGATLDWDLPGPVVDKHSTGGVGDNVSLVLAPALAACGVYVPMISGRGLGHTGGTLDKLEAIPGYEATPNREVFQKVVGDVGCAIIGQTEDIAPADRRLYAVRDVTGTVESIDLITASILSKKLAAGLDALVLDVKTGSGAFMANPKDALQLASTLTSVANDAGCKTAALLTDMDAPLASAAGNALEVANALDLLTGSEVDARLWDVTVALGAEALALCGMAKDRHAGTKMMSDALTSGAAAARFDAMVRALGGPADLLERYREILPAAPIVVDVMAKAEGFVARIDTRAIGLAVVDLGGGRERETDEIDPSVGLDRIEGIGASVEPDTPLARVHARDQTTALAAEKAVRQAYTFATDAPDEASLIRNRVA